MQVRHGQLVIGDGIGDEHRERKLTRSSREIRRIVLLGHTGYVTLDALRWMSDVGIGFAQIDLNGQVIATSGHLGRNDARLRRAQALSLVNGIGLGLARDLIARKLEGQAGILRHLRADEAQNHVLACRAALDDAPSLDAVRRVEADAALSYWQAWAGVEMCFDKRSIAIVPDHWRRFGQRGSPLAMGARLATNPPNAILNYCYALAEIECTLALQAVGLDPGLGVLHADQKARDSMALDLLEAIRPDVDEWVLGLVMTRSSRERDFHETRQGVCRILPPLSHVLAETLPHWRPLAGSTAEHLAKAFSDQARLPESPTPLTQANRSRSRSGGRRADTRTSKTTTPPAACKGCGETLSSWSRRYCASCAKGIDLIAVYAKAGPAALAKMRAEGRDPSASGAARHKVGKTNLAHRKARLEWESVHKEAYDPAVFRRDILPRLQRVPISRLVAATGLSAIYCSRIRRGLVIPHMMHWEGLSRAVDQ
jgi:CRISPR-associated endonuclease Cas1